MGTGEGKDEGEGKGMDGPKHTSAYSAAGASTPGPTHTSAASAAAERSLVQRRWWGMCDKIVVSVATISETKEERWVGPRASTPGLFHRVRVAGARSVI